jgi:hypothetical protein
VGRLSGRNVLSILLKCLLWRKIAAVMKGIFEGVAGILLLMFLLACVIAVVWKLLTSFP